MKFEVIEKPNDWTKEVKKSESANETQQQRYDYWVAFQDYAFQNAQFAKNFNRRKPSMDHWMNFNAKEIDWKQGNGIKTGDIVYMYVASSVSAILYKCKVTSTDIPYDYRDGSLTITSLMKIRLQKRYKPEEFTFKKLKDEYGVFAIRGPRGIPHSLSEALKK